MKRFKRIVAGGLILCLLTLSAPTLAAAEYTTADTPATLEAAIESLVQGRDIGLYYESLDTGQIYTYRATARYPSASTTKLPIVLCTYQMASDGQLNLDEEMTYRESYYYGGSGIIQYQLGKRVYTLRQLVQYAVQYSDNIAYNMLRARLGNALFTYIQRINAQFVNNFNAEEVAVYMRAVYDFVASNEVLGAEFLSFFVDTQFEERIPQATPALTVAHKIGWLPLENIYHDAAVVYDDSPYLLVIMTRGAKNNDPAFFMELAGLIHRLHMFSQNDRPLEAGRLAINGFPVDVDGAYLEKGTRRVMLPLDALLDYVCIDYEWDAALQRITYQYGDVPVTVNGVHQIVFIDHISQPFASVAREGTLYVPMDTISLLPGLELVSEPMFRVD